MPFFRIFQHLLPRSRAWNLLVDRTLRKFFSGLAQKPSEVRTYVDQVYEDLYPATTRELAAWESQFGIPQAATEQDRRDAIAAAWQAQGGQDKTYLESVIQAAGFDVYLHEWWGQSGAEVTLFDGTDDHVVVGDALSFEFDQVFTVAFWINRYTTASGIDVIIGKKEGAIGSTDSGSPGWVVWVSGTSGVINLEIQTDSGDWLHVFTSSGHLPHETDAWHHVIIAHRNNPSPDVAIYVDGSFVASSTGGSFPSSGTAINARRLLIGASDTGTVSQFLAGALDEVVVLDIKASLGGGQVATLYNGGSVIDYTTTGLAGNILGYWRMGEDASFPTIPDLSGSDNDGTMTNMDEANLVLRDTLLPPTGTTGDFVARDPRDYTTSVNVGSNQCGDPDVQCRAVSDGPFRCNRFATEDALYLVNKTYSANAPPPIPSDEAFWPYFIYVGDEVFPNTATVPLSRKGEFERLLLKLLPAQQWIVLLIDYQQDFGIFGPTFDPTFH